MDHVCRRCSATLEQEANYCKDCGAPQIRYVPQEEDSRLVAAEAIAPRTTAKNPGNFISWKMTIRIAAVVAVGVGALCALLAAGSVLWVAAGAMAVVGIYHRRSPMTVLGPRIGARVGALVGLMVAAIALAGNAILLVVQRYGMHQGGQIDKQLTMIVKQAAARAATMDPQAPVTAFANFWLSAEGRVGLILLTMGFLAVLIVLFAIAGGVLGAQIYRPSRGNKALP